MTREVKVSLYWSRYGVYAYDTVSVQYDWCLCKRRRDPEAQERAL